MLGKLTSAADPEIGRKAGTPAPLTAAERHWIEAVIVRLIRRVGERASGRPQPKLTMADLPAL
jgi:hypothetical protein